MISENGFRAILGLSLETPFETGFRQGRQSGEHVTPRQIAEIDLYLNGRDDGVAGDVTRIDAARAAELWPFKNWAAQ